MTEARIGTVSVDQFIAAPPAKVWRALTEPELLAKWWVPGDVEATVGHRFHLEMPGFGSIPCTVTEVEPYKRFVYSFNGHWMLTWRLVEEGHGTRLLLDHTGFELDDKREKGAYENMGIGWRDTVLPRLAQAVPQMG
ncbi:uncharacterized protein YndB with AHSA1/START domain [Rhodococcus sp. LBL1]|jgi:uncharacterized protein YndB with AHSA1/START domain|uniref:Uncharacterized protein YndB with AHSA1/START domain n=1 Tax=Prescottella agglutinans TaxID=1644129 RepID=A0ABT6MDM9_9NOCA|nr:SRPBCC domain-containing protein [Prescottella agglutinans]MDH6282014.1 uncharacterized protein YndB with AHSA1/START domain [Prescottella agglutinans]MDH6677631.1 uncharacterized protein YndB with AHSA1/START domain [Rhodococcus sp. LBL1]MDH6683218.1 uncharacterized protein YndB with AHSA1/START domain [Rhodococcus sp. LBL2]